MSILITKEIYNKFGEDIIKDYKAGMSNKALLAKYSIKYPQSLRNFLKREKVFMPLQNGRNSKRLYSICHDYFENIDTDTKAYIIGFILADGYVDLEYNRLSIELSLKDIDILLKIRKELCSNSPIRIYEKSCQISTKPDRSFYYCKISFNSSKLVSDLSKIGFKQSKDNEVYSSVYDSIENRFKSSFFRGNLDGDGSYFVGQTKSGWKQSIQVVGPEDFLKFSYSNFFESNSNIIAYKNTSLVKSFVISKYDFFIRALSKIYNSSDIFLDRKLRYLCAHLKPCELLETLKDKLSRAISIEVLLNEYNQSVRNDQRLSKDFVINYIESSRVGIRPQAQGTDNNR